MGAVGFTGVVLVVAPCVMAVEPRSGSRWSARSAARTNDLGAGKVDRMLVGADGEGRVCGSMSWFCSSDVGWLRFVGVPAPRLI
jgi:hypothetical protein